MFGYTQWAIDDYPWCLYNAGVGHVQAALFEEIARGGRVFVSTQDLALKVYGIRKPATRTHHGKKWKPFEHHTRRYESRIEVVRESLRRLEWRTLVISETMEKDHRHLCWKLADKSADIAEFMQLLRS